MGERQLEQLVVQFGEKKLLEALNPLVTKCKWNDWQCVANAIRRLARARERKGPEPPTRLLNLDKVWPNSLGSFQEEHYDD